MSRVFDDPPSPWYRERREEQSWMDLLQVCMNGHTITAYGTSEPESLRKRCSECGAETMTHCKKCNTPLPGHYPVPGVISFHVLPCNGRVRPADRRHAEGLVRPATGGVLDSIVPDWSGRGRNARIIPACRDKLSHLRTSDSSQTPPCELDAVRHRTIDKNRGFAGDTGSRDHADQLRQPMSPQTSGLEQSKRKTATNRTSSTERLIRFCHGPHR